MSDRVEVILRGSGLSDKPWDFDSNIHSWRCERPDTYGVCNCFQELVEELNKEIRKAKEEAWDEGCESGEANEGCGVTGTEDAAENPYRKEKNE